MGFRRKKLSAEQRIEIVERVRKGYLHSHLAIIYGVSRPRISQISKASDEQIEEWVRIANLPPLKFDRQD